MTKIIIERFISFSLHSNNIQIKKAVARKRNYRKNSSGKSVLLGFFFPFSFSLNTAKSSIFVTVVKNTLFFVAILFSFTRNFFHENRNGNFSITLTFSKLTCFQKCTESSRPHEQLGKRLICTSYYEVNSRNGQPFVLFSVAIF